MLRWQSSPLQLTVKNCLGGAVVGSDGKVGWSVCSTAVVVVVWATVRLSEVQALDCCWDTIGSRC